MQGVYLYTLILGRTLTANSNTQDTRALEIPRIIQGHRLKCGNNFSFSSDSAFLYSVVSQHLALPQLQIEIIDQ